MIDLITEKLIKNSKPYQLELGSYQIRTARLLQNQENFICDELAAISTPLNTSFSSFSGSVNFEPDAISESISKILKKNRFIERYVALVLPDQAFCFGSFSVPAVAARAGIQPLLEREIKKTAFYDFKDLIVRYELGARNNNQISVFFAALPYKTMQLIQQICENSNLVPVSVQPTISGLTRLMKTCFPEAKHPVVFLHFGNEAVTAAIYKNEGLLQVQVIEIGVRDLRNRLIEDMGLTYEDADNRLSENLILLDDPSTDAQLEIPEYAILESVFASLLQRIYGYLLLFSNDHPEETGFTRIVLSGGGSRIKNIDKLISANLGITTTLLSQELEGKLKIVGKEAFQDIELFMPLFGNAMLKPWLTDRFERIFSS